jgi:hypothetical protein
LTVGRHMGSETELPEILTSQEAIHLVSQHGGVAIVTELPSVGLGAEGVVSLLSG